MQPNTKHTLIAEIIGRIYVKRNARNIKMVAESTDIYYNSKLNGIRKLPRLSVVSNECSEKLRCKQIYKRRVKSSFKGYIRGTEKQECKVVYLNFPDLL